MQLQEQGSNPQQLECGASFASCRADRRQASPRASRAMPKLTHTFGSKSAVTTNFAAGGFHPTCNVDKPQVFAQVPEGLCLD